MACTFRATFNQSEDLGATFGEVVEVVRAFNPYEGPYEVIPKTVEQILATKDKDMEDDVTVHEIPYAETTNVYGVTVSIAS